MYNKKIANPLVSEKNHYAKFSHTMFLTEKCEVFLCGPNKHHPQNKHRLQKKSKKRTNYNSKKH